MADKDPGKITGGVFRPGDELGGDDKVWLYSDNNKYRFGIEDGDAVVQEVETGKVVNNLSGSKSGYRIEFEEEGFFQNGANRLNLIGKKSEEKTSEDEAGNEYKYTEQKDIRVWSTEPGNQAKEGGKGPAYDGDWDDDSDNKPNHFYLTNDGRIVAARGGVPKNWDKYDPMSDSGAIAVWGKPHMGIVAGANPKDHLLEFRLPKDGEKPSPALKHWVGYMNLKLKHIGSQMGSKNPEIPKFLANKKNDVFDESSVKPLEGAGLTNEGYNKASKGIEKKFNEAKEYDEKLKKMAEKLTKDNADTYKKMYHNVESANDAITKSLATGVKGEKGTGAAGLQDIMEEFPLYRIMGDSVQKCMDLLVAYVDESSVDDDGSPKGKDGKDGDGKDGKDGDGKDGKDGKDGDGKDGKDGDGKDGKDGDGKDGKDGDGKDGDGKDGDGKGNTGGGNTGGGNTGGGNTGGGNTGGGNTGGGNTGGGNTGGGNTGGGNTGGGNTGGGGTLTPTPTPTPTPTTPTPTTPTTPPTPTPTTPTTPPTPTPTPTPTTPATPTNPGPPTTLPAQVTPPAQTAPPASQLPYHPPGLGNSGPQPGFDLPGLGNGGGPGLGNGLPGIEDVLPGIDDLLPGLDGGRDALFPGGGENPVFGDGRNDGGMGNGGNWISQLTDSINQGVGNFDPGSWLTDLQDGHDLPGSDRRHDPAPGEGDFHTQQASSPGGVTAPSGIGTPPVLDVSAATAQIVDRMFPDESRDEQAPHATGLPGARFAARRSANNDPGERDARDSTEPDDEADPGPTTDTQWI
ncbi:hypothetical protein [Nocardia cyriacigeorgica]|nr:hypothetical protein [Nocardia cyriacigeorgica]